MSPTLEDGDWVLVDPDAYRDRLPSLGELVLVPDPRLPTRTLVKRVAGLTDSGDLMLAGDAPAASTDSRTFGAVRASSVEGRPWLRYWPPRRISRVG